MMAENDSISVLDEKRLKLKRLRLAKLRAQQDTTPAPADTMRVDQAPMGQMSPLQFGKEKVMDPLIRGASKLGAILDRFGGAPSRAFANEIINPDPIYYEEPFTHPGKAPVIQAPLAFARQIGRDPSMAPTTKEISVKRGISDMSLREAAGKAGHDPGLYPDVSPAGAVGLIGDIALDYTNLLPILKAGKLLGKGGLKATEQTLKAGGKTFDIATGGNVAEKVGAGAKSFSKTLGEGIKATFSGKRADDYSTYLDIAKKNDIDTKLLPESVEFGKASTISRAARAKGEGPAGEALRARHEKVTKQIDGALNEHVNKVSGGQIYNAEDVGEIVRDGFDRGVQKAFDELDVTYSSVMRDNPGLQIEGEALKKLNLRVKNLEGRMRAKSKRGGSDEVRSSARQVLNNIKSLKEANGSYKQTLEQLREVGDVSFGTGRQFKTPPNEKVMRGLYGMMRNALIETADDVAPMVGKQLRHNNDIMKGLIGEKSLLAKTLRNKDISDEAVFEKLILNGDTKRLGALKKFLEPEEWQAAKGSFMRSIMKENIEGDLAGRTLFNKLRDKESIVGALFDPGEMDNFTDLLKLKDRVGIPVLSTSGTGASNAFLNLAKETVPRAAESGIAKIITTKGKTKVEPLSKRAIKKGRRPALKGAQVLSVQERNK